MFCISAFREAVEHGHGHPAIWLLDLTDPVGLTVAKSLTRQTLEAPQTSSELAPTLVAKSNQDTAWKLLEIMLQKHSLESIEPPDLYIEDFPRPVLVIGAKGALIINLDPSEIQ